MMVKSMAASRKPQQCEVHGPAMEPTSSVGHSDRATLDSSTLPRAISFQRKERTWACHPPAKAGKFLFEVFSLDSEHSK